MSLGISLSVDARQVKEARKEIEFLNKGLREMEGADVAPDKDGLQATSALVRQISEDIRRMKGLVTKGEQQGGILKKEQFQEAATLSKRIGQNMAEYTKEITKAKTELSKLLAEKAKLERTSSSDPAGWVAAQERLEAIKGREKGLRENYEWLKRNDPKVQDLARRGRGYTETISGYGAAPDKEESGMGAAAASLGMMRKAGGYLALIMGGATLLDVARQTWSEYHKLAEKESGLLLRGVRFYREPSPWGYLQGESADMAQALQRTTGATDQNTLLRLQRFSRLSNMDPGQAMGFAGGFYQVTGGDANKQRQALDALLYMGKQAKDGRTEVLLQNINANLLTAFNAQGGKALSDAQVSQVIAQTTAMYNAPGTQGMGTEIFNAMQNALLPGGDSIDEILSWDIAGGFKKKGPLTARDFVDIQRRRARGLNDPANRKAAMDFIRRFAGNDRNMQILLAQKILKQQFGMPGSVETAEWFLDNYDRLQSAKMPGQDEILKGITNYTEMYKGTPAFDIAQRYVMDDFFSIEMGEENDPGARLFQEKKWQLKALITKHGWLKPSQYDQEIQKAAKKYGISSLWLKSIIQAESSYNPFVTSPKGARGLGQLMPQTGRAYGLKTDADFLDPAKNIDASAHYLADLLKQFGGDLGQATAAYNAGPSAVLSGRLPEETVLFRKKVLQYYNTALNDPEWRKTDNIASSAAPGNESVGLLARIATILDEISRKLGHGEHSSEVRRPMPVRPK